MTWSEQDARLTAGPWPAATLDPIARLRVLAAGLPGTVVEERRWDLPFDRVWGFVGDLERSVPTFDRSVGSIRALAREGSRLLVRAGGTWRTAYVPARFDVDLEPGWCWMVSRPRFYVVGMAAVPDGDGTRYAHLEGVALAGRALQPLARATTFKHRRHVAHDVGGIERALGLAPGRGPGTGP